MNSKLEHSPESDTRDTRSTDKSLTPLLDTINSPADLRALPVEKLPQVCDEIRSYLISCLSENPGHFGSSMGAVDIIVALHYVFDTPHDRLVWDVGHQAYAHKLLTGRREAFRTQRTRGGISGFPKIEESPFDHFGVGHSSTSDGIGGRHFRCRTRRQLHIGGAGHGHSRQEHPRLRKPQDSGCGGRRLDKRRPPLRGAQQRLQQSQRPADSAQRQQHEHRRQRRRPTQIPLRNLHLEGLQPMAPQDGRLFPAQGHPQRPAQRAADSLQQFHQGACLRKAEHIRGSQHQVFRAV